MNTRTGCRSERRERCGMNRAASNEFGRAQMIIRDFRVGDEMALQAVFFSAVRQTANRDYSPEQIEAWAPEAFDRDEWTQRMRGIRPFVVEDTGEIVAYADVQPDGYIDHFFVSGSRARQGIGSMLMQRIHEAARAQAVGELTSNVSRTAQPLFERFGFVVVEYRSPVTRGVVVPNAFMKKTLSQQEGAVSATMFIVRLIGVACLVAACAGSQPVKNHEAKDNVQSSNDIGCTDVAHLRNIYTPADLYRAIPVCVERNDYDSAVFISALAGVYARYDQMRVADESAYQAETVLRMKYLDSLVPDQQKKFVEVLRARTNSPTKLTAMCDQIRGIGPPHYFPTYMVQHGMARLSVTRGAMGS